MRVPLSWLREYCDPPLDARGIEERLTMTGTKVEAIDSHGVPSAEGFVVGRVVACEPHPDADRLRVCQVDLGPVRPEGPVTIVCGAPNVAAGQTVAVACPGAVLPGGEKLRKAKLRGVVSEGMILAEDELQIGPGHAGIMVLDELLAGDAELSPGTPLLQVLPISDVVLELEITTNRPDCLGLYGVARELHAATGAPLAPAPWPVDAPGDQGSPDPPADRIDLDGEEPVRVSVDCPDLCPRFTARMFTDVTVGPSPPWLKARLMAAGQRPINNVVDITNYAMLLTGQPLHAFDLDRVAGHRLTVRRAGDGEQVQTLDGQTRILDERMIVIEDAQGPTSIAGVMGGERSEVHEGTTRVLLEVASWDGPSIHRASWRLGLRSEASGRFEKGLAPEQCLQAQAVAAALLVECAGARTLDQAIDIGFRAPPQTTLRLRASRVRAILGAPVSRERQVEILQALDFEPREAPPLEGPGSAPTGDLPEDDVAGAVLEVRVPAVRRDDVTREIDLIEEIARIEGLERLPATLPARRGAAGMLSHAQRLRRTAEDELVGRGLHEIVGWSFSDPQLLDRLLVPADHPLRDVVRLENAMSEAQSVMRPTILGSLLDAARHNVSRGATEIALFESGRVYRAAARPDERDESVVGPADEHHALGALLSGPLTPRSWRSSERGQADFFAIKALLEAVLGRLRVQWSVGEGGWPFLHPGRSAAVLADGHRLGFLGELHPQLAEGWDLQRTAVFAIDLDQVARVSAKSTTFAPFAAVPPIRRDLAVTLPAQTPAADVLAAVRNAAGELLAAADVFDVYEGEQVGAGRRSLALGLTFQAADHTLADEEIAPAWKRIEQALEQIGGELRG